MGEYLRSKTQTAYFNYVNHVLQMGAPLLHAWAVKYLWKYKTHTSRVT